MNTFIETLKYASAGPALRVTKTNDGGFIIEGSGENNIVDSVHNASTTINDDPENHKKKGLAALGGAALSVGAGAYAMRNIPKVNVPAGQGPNPVAAIAIPAGLYYAANNLDRKDKAAIGAGVAASGLAIASKGAKTTQGPVLTNGQRATAALALAAPTALATYGVHELRKAEQIQRDRQAVATSTQPNDGVEAINVNKNKTFEERYPLLSLAPWKEKVKRWLD